MYSAPRCSRVHVLRASRRLSRVRPRCFSRAMMPSLRAALPMSRYQLPPTATASAARRFRACRQRHRLPVRRHASAHRPYVSRHATSVAMEASVMILYREPPRSGAPADNEMAGMPQQQNRDWPGEMVREWQMKR